MTSHGKGWFGVRICRIIRFSVECGGALQIRRGRFVLPGHYLGGRSGLLVVDGSDMGKGKGGMEDEGLKNVRDCRLDN